MSDKEVSKIKKEELLEQLEKWFSDSVSFDSEWRDNAEEWYNYYNGEQWSSDEVAALVERGQAVSTHNHIKPAIDAIIGGERSNRPETKMVGRTLDDQAGAEIKSSLYDYIVYNSNSDDEQDLMLKDAFITGRGWMKVTPREAKGDADLYHEYVDYRNMFLDGLSKRDDLKDCRYIHNAVFTDEDVVKKVFPKYKEGQGVNTSVTMFESSSDDNIWYAGEDRNRVRVIETWYRDESGTIHSAIWVKGQLLEHYSKPYELDRFPFAVLTINRDLNNFPYGLVKPMVSAQDEVNKRHSKALHYLNAKQVLAEEDAFVDFNDAMKTLAKPDGVTKLVDGALRDGKVQIIDNTALASAHLQMMDIAREEIMTLVGLNAGYMGQSSTSESGAKVGLNIQQAQNVLVPVFNKIRRLRHDIAYITMELAKEFYTSERVIRITQETGEYAFMPINAMQEDEFGVIHSLNDISDGDVDIIIAEAPATLNDQQEQFQLLMQLQGQTPNPIPMEILLRYSGIKDKNKLAAELGQYNNIQAQLQQAGQQMEQMAKEIERLGGVATQYENQIVQIKTAAAVDKEVGKVKQKAAALDGAMKATQKNKG